MHEQFEKWFETEADSEEYSSRDYQLIKYGFTSGWNAHVKFIGEENKRKDEQVEMSYLKLHPLQADAQDSTIKHFGCNYPNIGFGSECVFDYCAYDIGHSCSYHKSKEVCPMWREVER
jgi:hypothetical protein